MTLAVIYKRSIIYPGLLLLPVVFVLAIIDNWDYRSEWLTRQDAIGLTIISGIVYFALISLLSLTMFLNHYFSVRSSVALSWLSWFLIPGGFICLVIGKAINEYHTVGSSYEIRYSIIFNLPYVTGLIWGFRKFRSNFLKALSTDTGKNNTL